MATRHPPLRICSRGWRGGRSRRARSANDSNACAGSCAQSSINDAAGCGNADNGKGAQHGGSAGTRWGDVTRATATEERRHLTDDEVAAYLDGELTGRERGRLGRHLATCRLCARQVAATAALLGE